MYWFIFWQNALYLYLGKSKLGLMYQQVCKVYFTNCVIKNMKIDPRNKWKKFISLNLDTSIYQGLMKKLDISSIYRDLQVQKSQIWNSAMMT